MRRYRFAPIDRTGVVLGLDGPQCGVLGVGVLVTSLGLRGGVPLLVALVPTFLAAMFGFGRWSGWRLDQIVPTALRFALSGAAGRRRWLAALPRRCPAQDAPATRRAAPPPFLSGIELHSVPGDVAVVWDRRSRTVSASLRVSGRPFTLLKRSDQEHVLQQWGDVLAGFCAEGTGVAHVRITEWSGPTGALDAGASRRPSAPDLGNGRARQSYDDLVDAAGRRAVGHEVLVTVTVDTKGARSRTGDGPPGAAVTRLLEELQSAADRIEPAGLAVYGPLSVSETAETLRRRLDPSCIPTLVTRRCSLAELAGVVSIDNAGPLSSIVDWRQVGCDRSLHRTYWIAEWPRLDVGADWLSPFLLHGAGTRTFSLHLEPVTPSRSRRRIERDSTRLVADEAQRTRAGFRIGAHHRRSQAAVLERETELVAGHAEFEYVGFVTVTAADEQSLARSCAAYEQLAAQSGMELRALDGRHDKALACALPVGRGLARHRSL